MHLVEGSGIWVLVGASFATFLVAAKFHGRQIRLEREQQGFHDVDFRSDRNPPWVVALWARDRRGFWLRVATLEMALMMIALVLVVAGEGLRAWPLLLVAALLWIPTVAFARNGLTSARRFQRARHAGTREMQAEGAGPVPDEAWASRALRGTIAWGLLLAVGVAVLAWLGAA